LSPDRHIRVSKRDGTIEPFQRWKLRCCLLRVVGPQTPDGFWADALSAAVQCYIRRRGLTCVSSAAVLEMALTALRAVCLEDSARRLEQWHTARARMRGRLRLYHQDGRATNCTKQWLVEHLCKRWSLRRTTARILAGQLEKRLIRAGTDSLTRSEVLGMLERLVSAYGLVQTHPSPTAGAL